MEPPELETCQGHCATAIHLRRQSRDVIYKRPLVTGSHVCVLILKLTKSIMFYILTKIP